MEPRESDEDKLKREINDDFEKAIKERMSAIENEVYDDNGNKFERIHMEKVSSIIHMLARQ